jgi:shikimate dehydrogenase
MENKIKKFAVLGHPISHSLSPQIHSLFAKEFSIDLEYQKFDINQDNFLDNIERLAEEGYAGLNITLPLKNNAFQICDEVSERASLCKSVNTIIFSNNKILGDSTDGRGLVSDLKNKNINIKDKNILLVGAGGAANGVIYDLVQGKPKKILLTNRTFIKAIKMKDYWKKFSDKHRVIIESIELKYSHKINIDLIINATSASITSNNSPITAATFNFLNIEGACYDMMYGTETPFMKCASKKTDAVYDGLGMLIEQAAVSFNIWHKLNPTTIKIEKLLKNL